MSNLKWTYYNEIDWYCCEWLQNLMDSGHIPSGEIDSRPIQSVTYEDIKDFRQCHFFAGIGGWPLALKLSNWPDNRPVWTGSCPCQPFSIAGKRKQQSDSRHLWPFMHSLIWESVQSHTQPPIIFGEQVASADGRNWLSGVRSDLEELGYVFGAADLCAAGTGKKVAVEHKGSIEHLVIGAPHIRQRLYWGAGWLADARCKCSSGWRESKNLDGAEKIVKSQEEKRQWLRYTSNNVCAVVRLPHPPSPRLEERAGVPTNLGQELPSVIRDSNVSRLGYTEHPIRGTKHKEDQNSYRGYGLGWNVNPSRLGVSALSEEKRFQQQQEQLHRQADYGIGSILLPCIDHKYRRTQSGIHPLANGVPYRVDRLRAYGNAIAPPVAREFIISFSRAVKDYINA